MVDPDRKIYVTYPLTETSLYKGKNDFKMAKYFIFELMSVTVGHYDGFPWQLKSPASEQYIIKLVPGITKSLLKVEVNQTAAQILINWIKKSSLVYWYKGHTRKITNFAGNVILLLSYSHTVIALKFISWHNSSAVVACTEFGSKLMINNWNAVRSIFHQIVGVLKKSLVKLA